MSRDRDRRCNSSTYGAGGVENHPVLIQRAAPAAGASPVGDSRKVFVRPKRLGRLRVVVRRGPDAAIKMNKTGAKP